MPLGFPSTVQYSRSISGIAFNFVLTPSPYLVSRSTLTRTTRRLVLRVLTAQTTLGLCHLLLMFAIAGVRSLEILSSFLLAMFEGAESQVCVVHGLRVLPAQRGERHVSLRHGGAMPVVDLILLLTHLLHDFFECRVYIVLERRLYGRNPRGIQVEGCMRGDLYS
ncbi:hypothetical protein F4861DRAFT_506921 [Xylaria intraflava]|nr:hypothetical protein F4861DRAFT_506921 [Xylaria intraflava]